MIKINILGTDYKIIVDNADNPGMKDCDGYCCAYANEIHVADLSTDDEWKNEPDAVRENRTKQILRHEIIHAFLHESGLYGSSLSADRWALNEEMVDWIAIQFPKILEAFKEAGCLDSEEN